MDYNHFNESVTNVTIYGERGIVTDTTTIVFGVISFTFFLGGGIMNTVILATIIRKCENRDLILIFIAAFCITDLLSTIISPFWWYRSTIGYEHYRLPEIFCKLSMMGITTSILATSMLILALAVIRYTILRYPLGKIHFTSVKIKIIIGCIYVIALVIGILTGLGWKKRKTDGLTTKAHWYGDCTQDRREWIILGRVLSVGIYPILVILPMIIVFILSLLMLYHLRTQLRGDVLSNRQHTVREKKEKIISIQFLLIVLGFMIGYIPLLSNIVRKAFGSPSRTIEAKRQDHDISYSIYLIQRFSEMLNPCLYLVGSSSLRRRVHSHIRSSVINSSCIEEDTISRASSSTISKQTQKSMASNKLARKNPLPAEQQTEKV